MTYVVKIMTLSDLQQILRSFIKKLLTKKVWKNNVLFRLYIILEIILNYIQLQHPPLLLPNDALLYTRIQVHCFSRKLYMFHYKNTSKLDSMTRMFLKKVFKLELHDAYRHSKHAQTWIFHLIRNIERNIPIIV